MFLNIVLFVIGLAVLIQGSQWMVNGASSLAARLKVSPLIIGLTIVAFGTSAPELLVSVASTAGESSGIALGNVIGSNLTNILLILGVSSMIYPSYVKRSTVWKEIPFAVLGSLVITVFAFSSFLDQQNWQELDFGTNTTINTLGFSSGIILLLFFCIFLYYVFTTARANRQDEEIEVMPLWKSLSWSVAGLVGLAVGGNLAVDNAQQLALEIGVPEGFIGLTLVAIGTSLPELVTAITSALKKQSDLAIGNVVGSNIFNSFFVLGTSSLVGKIEITGENLVDILISLAASFFLFAAIFIFERNKLGRSEGGMMLAFYLSYLTYLFINLNL